MCKYIYIYIYVYNINIYIYIYIYIYSKLETFSLRNIPPIVSYLRVILRLFRDYIDLVLAYFSISDGIQSNTCWVLQ